MRILVTGGLGYIGSHTVLELIKEGHEPIVIDNLSNSLLQVKDKIEELSGRRLIFYKADACDSESVSDIFKKEKIQALIHFAGYKAVGESVEKPLKYYKNNLISSICLLEELMKIDGAICIFSSSATVYSEINKSPLTEEMPIAAGNPYGWTKIMVEQIIRDLAKARPDFTAINLRYFNPIGAHPSALLGERPLGKPNNLMPLICRVADGSMDELSVFGDDYDTPDGTCVRDYIHVMDLAKGHVRALDKMKGKKGIYDINLGTGRGTSVLELIHAFEKANNIKIPYRIGDRRPGDLATLYADTKKAESMLDWKAQLSIEEACRSAWEFQKMCRKEKSEVEETE